MRPNDIENWALNIIERVESKQPVEDLRIELKAEWPKDINKAARQIAGHANAAHGEPILWLLGVDEKEGVKGINYEEMSNWKQAIEAKFDELSPSLTHLDIPYEGKTIVALLWETERRPFLVKTPEGGAISLEVPWRDATSTRTANRTDLLKMLYPVIKSPSFEVIKGEFIISKEEQDTFGQPTCIGGLSLYVYIVPGSDDRVVIPYHKCEVKLKFINNKMTIKIEDFLFKSSAGFRFQGTPPPSPTIDCTPSEIIITGPGRAIIETNNPSLSTEQISLAAGDMDVEVRVHPVNAEAPISIISKFQQAETPKGSLGRWIMKPS